MTKFQGESSESERESGSSGEMAVGVRDFTVLGEFKPFGLIAEALDGKSTDNFSDKYDYFLFDPEIAKDRDELDASVSPIVAGGCDHEIFIRGNRIMWIMGSRVYKRFTLSSSVIMACWCRMAHTSDAVLCVLQVDSLAIFNTAGEVITIQLPGIVTSIWPLPFGLLVQQAADGNPPTYSSLSSSSSFLSARDISLPKREVRQSPAPTDFYDHGMKHSLASLSSHLILTDPLDEPQPTYTDERGKLKIMHDFDERTIWTSDRVPLIASYNRDKMQHSLWVAESVNPFPSEETIPSSHAFKSEDFPKCFSFRRIWQGKGSRTAASKVFLATDDDAAPVICFLFQDQKTLLSIRLQTVDFNDDILVDVKPDMSWSVQAIAAEPVAVTPSRAKAGLLPSADILILDPDNTVFLYPSCEYLSFLHPFIICFLELICHACHDNQFDHMTLFLESLADHAGLFDSPRRYSILLRDCGVFKLFIAWIEHVFQRISPSLLAHSCISVWVAMMLPSSFKSSFRVMCLVKLNVLLLGCILLRTRDQVQDLACEAYLSGKQCLCKYVLPSSLCKQLEESIPTPENSTLHNVKILGLADAVGARINLVLNNGQMVRCALQRSPSCSLANDCITAMAEGVSSPFYNHFLQLLWGYSDSSFFPNADSSVDSEWESFKCIITQLCTKPGSTSHQDSLVSQSSWDFLIRSEFCKSYCDNNFLSAISTEGWIDRPETYSLSPSREAMHSPEGFSYSKCLIQCLDSLHAVYEDLKLFNLRRRDLRLLAVLLCDISSFLGEVNYADHYIRDFPFLSKKIRCQSSPSPRSPPSLYRWLENCLLHGFGHANIDDIPLLVRKGESSAVCWSRKVVSFYSLLSGARRMGTKLSSGVSCKVASGSSATHEEQMVLAMVAEGFGLQQLDLLPIGVSLPLRHAIDKCRECPPTDWPAAAYVLVGREDMALSCTTHSKKSEELETHTNRHLISMSAPYMLHLQPVTIPSNISDTSGSDNLKFEDVDSSDVSTIDGMEHLFNSSTQLRYGRDIRLNEVRRLLCSARPVAIQTSANPTASDQDLQQAQLWQFAQRTTALPFGRGAFTLVTTCTLLTEALTVPKLVLAGRLPAQQNATVNLDPNLRNLQELQSWPEFHNAVAAGLRLQGKMSRTWIIYNKPEEPNPTHGGLLFALGLHGHLTVLIISDIFHYYAKDHECTTVGLMLGLAASYRGTMQPTMSKSFYVHLPAYHPSSFPELEVPTLLQSAALMSLGLLFEGSAHPQTMQFLLAEIGHRSGGDNVLEREGYAVSAGFSLGLVALGRGEDKFAFMDTLVDRLFHYAGGNVNEKSLLTTVTNEHRRGAAQMVEGVPVNIDVTAPGAILALALMFLKTESEVIVARLSIPQTNFELQYLRPDFIMLRVIARNLIMWSRINPSMEWVESQIPQIVKDGVENLGYDKNDMDEMDEEAVVQAYVNIVAGACISLGLKYAGSRNGNAQELLYSYAIYFLNEIKAVSGSAGGSFPRGLSKFVDRSTLESCLHLVVLSLALVMAGSGNLQTLRLLRFLRSRNSSDGQANFGIQMAVSLAIGFLFLGGGMRSFSTSKSAIAALLITLYPRFPTGPNDNRCHLQAYRHFYVLATEGRWVQTVDVDTGLSVYAPLEITIKETDHHAETSFCEVTPCILPERDILKTVRVCGPRYWPQVIELTPEDKPWWVSDEKNHPFNSGVLYIKRKVGACSYVDDPVGCQSLISRAMNKAFSLTGVKCYASNSNSHVEAGANRVDHLVSTFSSDPSLIAFALLCCDSSNNRSDIDFQEFCLQVLFECVSKDRPALLQVYMSLYTVIRSMADQVTTEMAIFSDSLSISDLKLVVAYNEAMQRGRLTTSRDSILQSNFLGSLRRRIEELLDYSQELKTDFHTYLAFGKWPEGEKCSLLLSWYLQWFCIPSPSVVKNALEKIKPKLKTSSSSVPLLRLMFPRTHVTAISEISKLLVSI